MRTWIAVGFLAGSWLLGLGYFEPPRYFAWLPALLAGVLLLVDIPVRFPARRRRVAALLLLLPVVWFAPVPHQGIAGLLSAGGVLSLVPGANREPRRPARGAVLAAAILVPQALVLAGYQQMTARTHELPGGMAQLLVTLVRAAGVDAALDQATLVLRDASTTVRVAATWELLWDPATIAFLVGGWALLIAVAAARGAAPWRAAAFLLLITLVWAPLRALLLVGLVAHLQLRSDPVMLRNVGEVLVSTWAHLGLLGALAVFTGAAMPTLIRTPRPITAPRNRPTTRSSGERRLAVASLCVLTAAVTLATFLHFWTPVGQRKGGRVKVVERHSNWEPTTVPYGTKVYGEAGSYNYAAAYEYGSQFYEMSRLLEQDPIDDATLATCDVLIIKTPTARYDPEEVAAVVRFVEQGGSLLLIGDHTNVFNMTTFLNDITRPLGFTYRNDLLFQIGDPYKQAYQPPWTSHPVVQHVPPMFFAVSCSIDPGRSSGAMVIRNTGLWNLQPAYHETNYHPQAEYRPEMQYGAWCQLWGTTHGQGRVLAFTDSTLFSNFCIYQPGKAELFIGMLEWLNRSSPWDQLARRRLLGVATCLSGLAALVLGFLYFRQRRGNWLLLAALAGIAWTFGALMARGTHRQAMPLPPRHHVMSHVVIDRTLSSVPLFTGAFADDEEGGGYGMLEQWIPRIGNYISRESGPDVFQGDGLAIIVPTQLPGEAYREQLVNWVLAGGKLMVFDTPDIPASTANSLLMLFGLESIRNAPELEGEPLRIADGSAETPLRMSCEIRGGEPVALWGETPVASRIEFGKGTVTAVGFGSLFNDTAMGQHWLADPDELLLGRYEVLYALLRAALPHQSRD